MMKHTLMVARKIAGPAAAGGVRFAALASLCVPLALLSLSDRAIAQSAVQDATYQAVLANPDSVTANLALLDAQFAAGDFQGAATTLQRMLLVDPTYDAARLTRAAVLLRIGDDAGAAADLAYLETRPLSDAQRAEAARLAAHVRSSSAAPRIAGFFRFGTLYDSNPDLAPGSGLVGNQAFSFPEDGGFGAFGQLMVNGEVPLGGRGHALLFEADAFGRVHDDGDGHSYVRGAVGPRIDLGFAFLDLMAIGSVDFLDGEHYGTRLGGRAELTFDVSDRIVARLRVEAAHDAVDVAINTTRFVGDADGFQLLVRPSVTYRVSDAFQVTAFGAYTAKDAGSDWYSYDALTGGLTLAFRATSGIALEIGGEVQSIDYDAANPNVFASTVARDDMRYTAHAALSAPMSLLAFGDGEAPAWMADWSVEAFTRYQTYRSNIDVYDSSTWSVGLSIARRFSL